jgi:hypothetical protein
MFRRITSQLFVVLAIVAAPLFFAGCENADEGPVENGAEAVEEAAEETEEAVEEAGEEVRDEIDDATTD